MRASLLVVLLSVVAGDAWGASLPAGIDWHRGSVESAFETARRRNRPLFLYWGAVWCPPCNQIKRVVFSDARFQEAVRAFVPVYLDGDTERAQVWGEKLGAAGYPSMLLLSPAGEEVARIPTGVQVDRFVELMRVAQKRTPSIARVVERALAGRAKPAEWRLVAYYDWHRPGLAQVLGAEPASVLRQLLERVPQELTREGDRLFVLQLLHDIERAQDNKAVLAAGRVSRSAARLSAILADHQRVVASLEPLQYEAATMIKGLYPRSAPRAALVAPWLSAMKRVEDDEALSPRERLLALLPAIELYRLQQQGTKKKRKPVEQALGRRVRHRVRWATSVAKDAYGRPAVISVASTLLSEAGLPQDARRLLLAELPRAGSPHYLMSKLASLARDAGDKKGALRWLARAHREAKGRATRFQWGVQYLQGLMQLAPEDVRRIATTASAVVAELLMQPGAFFGRNADRLARLTASFGKWADRPPRRKVLFKAATAWLERCAAVPVKHEARQRCKRAFAKLVEVAGEAI